MQQFGNGSARYWVEPLAGNFAERFEHEVPLSKARMRHAQSSLVNHFRPVKNQVEIERARRTLVRSKPTSFSFNSQEGVQQGTGTKGGAADDGAIQKWTLWTDADRFGFIPRRNPRIGKNRLQSPNGEIKVRLAVANIAAERNRDVIQSNGCRALYRAVH